MGTKNLSSTSVNNMTRKEFIKDMSKMENICIRLTTDCDIWQNEAIYDMAVAILHILQDILKKDGKLVCYDCEMRYDCFPGESVPPCMKGAR